MTMPPDKLFQQRLENFSKNPPPKAWERIEAGLNKKKSNPGWMMIAASVVVVVVAASMIYYKSPNAFEVASTTTEPVQINQEKSIQSSSQQPIVNTTGTQKSTPEPQSGIFHQPGMSPKSSKKLKGNSLSEQVTVNNNTEKHIPDPDSDPTVGNTTKEVASEESISSDETETTLTTQADNALNERKPQGRKITYSASDVHARFLKEKQSITLSPNEKPVTGLEKIFDLTYSLKNGETSIGHLRRLKNDFISGTFTNQKNKKQ